MNSGLLTFPKPDQLLRGGDLLKMNKHLNGFPLPSAHPKIVNGLHAFPKQDIEYGVYFSAGLIASVGAGGWALTDKDFTIELRALIINTNYHGCIGCGHSSISYNNTFSSGWGFCDQSSLGVNPVFKMQDVSRSLVYQFNLQLNQIVTHTVVRDNQRAELRYYVNRDLINVVNINVAANLYGTYRNNGFNYPSTGMSFILSFMRISTIARTADWINYNYNNKHAIDANVTHLYRLYDESGNGMQIKNIAYPGYHAGFSSGSASPIWVTL